MQHSFLFIGWLYFCKIWIDSMKKKKKNGAVMPELYSSMAHRSSEDRFR